jgi:hypothetical protein
MDTKQIESEYMTVAQMRDAMHLKSYQYARQMIVTNRYGLGDATIEVMGRRLVNRAAVTAAVARRAARAKAEAAKA